MKITNELKETLDKQILTFKSFKLAFENMKELAEQNEDAYCQVLIVITKLLNELGSKEDSSVK